MLMCMAFRAHYEGGSMKVESIVLFVAVVGPDNPTSLDDIWFVTERYPVPLFGKLSIHFNQAVFQLEGRELSVHEVLEHLRPYYTKDVSEATTLPMKRLLSAVGPSIVEGLWIRVTGTIRAEGSLSDVTVDPERLAVKASDQDLPVRGYQPWDFELDPVLIELNVTPTYSKAERRS